MTITFHNHIDLSNKWIRRIKYLLYKLKEKFDQILYSHVYLNTENSKSGAYEIKVVLGLPGQDIVYSIADNEVDVAIKRLYNNLKRTLSRWKKKQN